jgi:DNA-binding NarL/FixJ family response regulator
MAETITIVLSDDHEVFLEGLRMVLEGEAGLTIAGTAHDGDSALRLVAEHAPDVLLLDLHMPGTEPAAVIARSKAVAPATKILVLSADTRREAVASAIGAGADGFVPKDASSRQVVRAIQTIVRGEDPYVSYVSPSPMPSHEPGAALLAQTLSPRERHVLKLLAAGHSNRQIADECYLSLNTVRTHVQNILVKLGVHSKLEAAAFAMRHGLVDPRLDEPTTARTRGVPLIRGGIPGQ